MARRFFGAVKRNRLFGWGLVGSTCGNNGDYVNLGVELAGEPQFGLAVDPEAGREVEVGFDDFDVLAAADVAVGEVVTSGQRPGPQFFSRHAVESIPSSGRRKEIEPTDVGGIGCGGDEPVLRRHSDIFGGGTGALGPDAGRVVVPALDSGVVR